MTKRNDLSDLLASSMDQVLNSKEHKSIFATSMRASQEAKVATASAPKEEHPAQQVFNLLVSASEELDKLGLSSSAARTLQAAEDIISEMSKEDENEAMDLPSESDMEEGVVDEGETLIDMDDPENGIVEGHPTDEDGDIININHHDPVSISGPADDSELIRVGPNHWIPRSELDPEFLHALDSGAVLNERLDLDPDQLSEEDIRSDDEYDMSPESKILDNMTNYPNPD